METIFTGDKLEIEKEIIRLKEQIIRTKNTSEATHCLASIYNLNKLYYNLTGADFLSFKKVEKMFSQKTYAAILYQKQCEKGFENSFLCYQELIRFISGTSYDCITNYFKKSTTIESAVVEAIFPYSEAILLIHDFLKEYHPKDLPLFHEMIEKKRIFHLSKMDFISEKLRGQCYPSYQGLPFILSQCSYYTVESLAYFIHEFGHASDFVDLNQRFSVNQQNKYLRCNFNDEITAKLYEKQFIEFAYQQNVDSESSSYLLKEYYQNARENLLETFLFTQFPDSLIVNQEYYKRSPENLKEELSNPLLENIVESKLDFGCLDLNSAIRYATGSLAAIVLQEHFDTDKQHGEDVYQHYMNQRTRPFSPEILSILEYREGFFSKILEKDVKIFSKLKN